MISCALCDNTFLDNRGLSAHIRKEHDEITWVDYKTKHPRTEVQVTETPVIEVPEEPKETDDTPLAERMDRMENMFNPLFSGYVPAGTPRGISDFPGEVIEVIGEKVNYKVALDPEIFSTYNNFKAICIKRGTNWDKDFSDFLMMSVRTAMSMYGIYDMVVEVRDSQILFDMPVGVK